MKNGSLMQVQFIFTLLLFLVIPSQSLLAQGREPIEIIVTGRQPGPPLWRVKNGENTLWILPLLSPIPEDIIWESEQVEGVIADAQEYITQPSANISISRLVLFNPINIFRGMRLQRQLSRNKDDATLQEVLPPESYERFAALKAQYFPRENNIERMRPLFAGDEMVDLIQDEVSLESADQVVNTVDRLVRRNRDISYTEIHYEMKLEGSFGDISNRLRNLMDSLSQELELSCFEDQLVLMEEDLEEIRYRASAWAQGYIDEFRFIPLRGDENDDCLNLMISSGEQETFEEILDRMGSMWLDAAENSLINNETTFSVLEISELLRDDGLLSRLGERGYNIIAP